MVTGVAVGRVRCEMTMHMASSFGKHGYGSKGRKESAVKDGFPPFFPALLLSFLTFFLKDEGTRSWIQVEG